VSVGSPTVQSSDPEHQTTGCCRRAVKHIKELKNNIQMRGWVARFEMFSMKGMCGFLEPITAGDVEKTLLLVLAAGFFYLFFFYRPIKIKSRIVSV